MDRPRGNVVLGTSSQQLAQKEAPVNLEFQIHAPSLRDEWAGIVAAPETEVGTCINADTIHVFGTFRRSGPVSRL